jgi:hypothetical protein
MPRHWRRQVLDDLDDLGAAGDAEFLELEWASLAASAAFSTQLKTPRSPPDEPHPQAGLGAGAGDAAEAWPEAVSRRRIQQRSGEVLDRWFSFGREIFL